MISVVQLVHAQVLASTISDLCEVRQQTMHGGCESVASRNEDEAGGSKIVGRFQGQEGRAE
jgi:hypothetical protein